MTTYLSLFVQQDRRIIIKTGGVFVKLEVRLFGGLSCKNEELPCFGKSEFFVQASDGITVQGLHEFLKLGAIPVVTAVNGVIEKKDHVLSDNDRLGIFPPLAGG